MKKQLLVNYSVAHSSPKGGWGARSTSGIYERTVAMNAFPAFRARCEAEGFEVLQHEGPLGVKIRMIGKAIKQAQRDGRPWVSVELHFNQTPLILCPNQSCVLAEADQGGDPVRRRVHAGVPCPSCGASTGAWKFGHTAFAWRNSEASVLLSELVLRELDETMPWSTRKKTILVPDPERSRDAWPNNIAWPRGVYRPAVLVEAGFGVDPRFSDWIGQIDNQRAYGLAVADGLCDFFAQHEATPIETWHT